MDQEQDTQQQAPNSAEPERVTPQEHNNVAMAVVAYIIFFIPLLTDAKNDPFVKFHVKQGFVLFLAWVLVSVASMVPPIFMISWVLHIGLLVLMILGIMNSVNHKQEELPLIGQFADKFKF